MAKPLVEVNITSWRKNRVPAGSEYGRVLVMPGTGYNCDRPLLYWAAQALAENGWRVDRMNVRNASDDLSVVTPVINGAIDGWVERVRTEDASGRLMLIGKSLTTLTYPHVARAHQLPFALLTPVINPADFDPTDQIIPVEEDGETWPIPARRRLSAPVPPIPSMIALRPISSPPMCMSTRMPTIPSKCPAIGVVPSTISRRSPLPLRSMPQRCKGGWQRRSLWWRIRRIALHAATRRYA